MLSFWDSIYSQGIPKVRFRDLGNSTIRIIEWPGAPWAALAILYSSNIFIQFFIHPTPLSNSLFNQRLYPILYSSNAPETYVFWRNGTPQAPRYNIIAMYNRGLKELSIGQPWCREYGEAIRRMVVVDSGGISWFK